MTVTPPFDPNAQPSAEWDMITLKWLGRLFTGATTGGELTIGIDRKQPMLYDDPTNPVTILPAQIKAPLSTITLVDAGESRQYMYVAVNVPASDDPDIIGTGFTYTASIKLASGQTYGPFTFTVPHDTPGGVLWLNKVISATPYPGEALPQITKAQFDAAVARIDALELGGVPGGGGGEVTQAELDALTLRVVAVESTPPNHAARHAAGGGDTVTLSAVQVTSGTMNAARLGTGSANSTTVLHGDGTWKVPPAPTGDDPTAVKLTGDQTIAGQKTFTDYPVVPDATWSIGKTSGLQTALNAKAPLASPTFTGTVAGVTKAMVGLSNVDNTSDASKTVTAAQVTSGTLSTARLGTGTADVTRVLYGDGTWKVPPSPTGDDPNAVKLTGDQVVAGVKTFSSAPAVPDGSFTVAKTTNLQSTLDNKANSSNPTFIGTVTGVTKAHVGLGNVDNTADSAKTIAGTQVTTGTVPAARLGSGTTNSTTSLYGDGTWKTAPTTDDPTAVKLTGNQTIAGVKTFSAAPVIPDASLTVGKTTGLQGALDGKAPTANPTFTGTVTGVTKAHVGLPNVDNTADAAKSIAGTQLTGQVPVARLGTGTADDTRVLYGDGAWKPAPSGGGTGDDPAAVKLTGAQTIDGVKTFTSAPVVPDASFTQAKVTGLATSLAALAPKASPTFTGTVTGITKAMVGLGNVDNVADASQTITATQITSGTIDNARLGSGVAAAGQYVDGGTGAWTTLPADATAVKLTGNQTIAGTKTFSAAPVIPDASLTIAKTTGLQGALDGKAPTASPTFTGTVTGVTKAAVGLPNVDNTADTAKTFTAAQTTTGVFSTARLGTGTADNSVVLFGDGTWKQPALGDDVNAVKLTGAQTVAGVKTFTSAPVVPDGAFAQVKISGLVADLAAKAPLASPTFTGTVSGITKSMVGLANVDNTADTAKVIAATQITTGTIANARLGTGTPSAGQYVDGGTGAWTALPAGGVPTYANVPAGATFTFDKIGSTWPARPTTRTDVIIRWRGIAPPPTLVGSGTAGMYSGDEYVEEIA